MKPQDKIKVGIELYKNMFFDPSRTQVRILLNLKKTDTAIINISTMKGGKAPEVLKYENYLVTSTCPVDIGFRGNELNLQDGTRKRSDQDEEHKGATPGGAINYGNDPTLSYIIFEHKGGNPLKISDIGIVMS